MQEHKARMYQELVGERGVSSTVLVNWVSKQGSFCIRHSAKTPVRNITALRVLWRAQNPEFILLSTELQDAGRTKHMVSVTRAITPAGSFWLMDSLLGRPVKIGCAKTFAKFLDHRYAEGWAAHLVFRNDQKTAPNKCEKKKTQGPLVIELDSSEED